MRTAIAAADSAGAGSGGGGGSGGGMGGPGSMLPPPHRAAKMNAEELLAEAEEEAGAEGSLAGAYSRSR
jgi:hypothetical protein